MHGGKHLEDSRDATGVGSSEEVRRVRDKVFIQDGRGGTDLLDSTTSHGYNLRRSARYRVSPQGIRNDPRKLDVL